MGNVIDGKRMRGLKQSRDKDSSSSKWQRASRRADARVEFRTLLVLRMGNYPRRQINHKLANGMNTWGGNGNTATLLFSLKGLEILHQERTESHSDEILQQHSLLLVRTC